MFSYPAFPRKYGCKSGGVTSPVHRHILGFRSAICQCSGFCSSIECTDETLFIILYRRQPLILFQGFWASAYPLPLPSSLFWVLNPWLCPHVLYHLPTPVANTVVVLSYVIPLRGSYCVLSMFSGILAFFTVSVIPPSCLVVTSKNAYLKC